MTLDTENLDIVMIEDSAGDVSSFRRAMSRVHPSARVVDIATGERGLAYIMGHAGSSTSLFLFDINLPGTSGLEVLKTAKLYRPSLPMMIMSSSTSEMEIDEAFRCGADGYVLKPFDFKAYDDIARDLCACWFEGAPLGTRYKGMLTPLTRSAADLKAIRN